MNFGFRALLSACVLSAPLFGQNLCDAVQNPTNGHYYLAVTEKLAWTQARDRAAQLGGYLATVTSIQEHNFVMQVAMNEPAAWVCESPSVAIGPWLGGFQAPGSVEPAGGWQWITGEPWGFQAWWQPAPHTQPNNTWGTEDRIHIFYPVTCPTGGGGWNDYSNAGNPGTQNLPGFIVEFNSFPYCVVAYCTSGTSSSGCAATVTTIGVPSLSLGSFHLDATNVEGAKTGLLFYGVNGQHAAPWGNGSTSFLCVKSPTQRTPAQDSGGTPGHCDGSFTLDFFGYLASHPGAIGQPTQIGQVFNVQTWYRDPPAPKTTNLSNGLEFTILP